MPRVSSTQLIVGALLLIATSSLPAQSTLEGLRHAYVRAHNAGDDSTLANLYTINAAYIGTGGDLTQGRDRIRAGLAHELPVTRDFALSDSVEGGQEGNTAWERGRWSMTFAVPGRPPEPWAGWYLIVCQRGSDSVWRIRNQVVTRDHSAH